MIKAEVTLRISGANKVIKKEFPTNDDAEVWIKKMSKNKAFVEGYSSTFARGRE